MESGDAERLSRVTEGGTLKSMVEGNRMRLSPLLSLEGMRVRKGSFLVGVIVFQKTSRTS